MKILALTPFNILPPKFGGAERCYNLLNSLDDVTVYALDWSGQSSQQRVGNMSYRLISADSKAIERAYKLLSNGVNTFDPMPMLTKNDLTTIKTSIESLDPDLIILEHPWLLDLIEDRPYIYDSHNCETYNTEQQLGRNSYDFDLVRDIESRAVNGAEHMFYTSELDLQHMRAYFEVEAPHTLIPNGTTLPEHTTDGTTKNLIFVGSAYGPNIHAAKQLIALAPLLPEYTIQIIGGCGDTLTSNQPNVDIVGTVSDRQLDLMFRSAYAFINLMSVGSGTHLKIPRALSYGVPVITTPVGARGYEGQVLTTTPANVPAMLEAIQGNWLYQSDIAREEAETLTWDNITKTYREVIYGLQ